MDILKDFHCTLTAYSVSSIALCMIGFWYIPIYNNHVFPIGELLQTKFASGPEEIPTIAAIIILHLEVKGLFYALDILCSSKNEMPKYPLTLRELPSKLVLHEYVLQF
jgi:hypothetical protein